jgi:hypothetical protein
VFVVIAACATTGAAWAASTEDVPRKQAARHLPAGLVQIAPTAAAPAGASSPGRLQPAPRFETVGSPRVVEYKTSSDVPDYNNGNNGNGITVPAGGSVPRSDYGIGMETGRMQGGGCFPVDPTTTTCLQEPDANGNLVTIQKARERWTLRLSYIDPTTPSATEVNIGFATNGFGAGGDSVYEWERRTPGGHSCFTFYPCDTYGFNLNEILGTAQWQNPSCAMKVGPGYHAYLFYQYSRYNATDTIPPGAQEWVPNTAATSTRLEQPGKILFSRAWSLSLASNALSISGPGIVNPEVDTPTGYPTAAPTIAPGTATVTVRSYDCGVIPNVAFTIDREFIQSSDGHAHTNQPSLDQVSSMGALSGTTDTNGNWTTTLTAGTISSTIKYTASTTNLLGQPFTAIPLLVTTGFVGMIDPGPGIPELRYTGQTTTHPSNHNASTELHLMLRDLGARYNLEADPADQGSLGLNDMSLPLGGLFDINAGWSSPHSRHRFGTDCDIDRRVQKADGSFAFADSRLLLSIAVNDMDGVGLLESGGRMHVQVPEYQVATILLRETR